MVWNFQDSYTKLPSIFYSKVNPENFSNKKLVLFNSDLARDLNLDFSKYDDCLLYTSPSPRDATLSRMPSSA